MTEDYLASGFRDVDAGAADKMARCLGYLDTLPAFQQYKRDILNTMNPQPGSTVADLGCGLGFDVRRLAALIDPAGRAIGVDASMRLLQSAQAASQEFAWAAFAQADIRKLPFADGVLQSCKVDRTLQHVDQPALVIQEMFRCLCSGGVAVCAEPDWGTFSIDVPRENGGPGVTQEVIEVWTNGFRNPRIGRELDRILEQAGFVDLPGREFLLSTPDLESSELVFDLTASALRLAKISDSDEPVAWLSRLRHHAKDVRCSVTLIVASGRRP